MSDHLRIERKDESGEIRPITLPEWKEAVIGIEGVRLADGDANALNPVTREWVVMPNRGGDVEVWRDGYGGWLRALWWSPNGTVSFAAPDPEPDGHSILAVARDLAGKLGADIVSADRTVHD
ncbi:hypothetical protein EDF56_1011108 [Novosphingobium sp. PhB165]|uniref:hypothetical protein n=1 Tax=Novosphingobium sp. PhB165 TaxID=2485105 RepID=UPI001043BC52|nr:hypothetical protein [Novosphingobium sp. PhB165]TCM22418.1 hypothetical protein EDF56_1011108 [Novosphingobium sp. PhB165]